MMKKCMKWISLALVCAALVVALPDPVPVEATSALEESIKQKQEAIAQAQEEQ